MENDQNKAFADRLDKILTAGQLAKLKIYQNYISRISNNEELKLAEKKHFDELDREFNEPSAGEKEYFTQDEVARKLGLSSQSIKWHTTRGNLKKNLDGKYGLATILEFERKYKRKKVKGGEPVSLVDEQEQADLRYRIARARWQELNVKQLRGKLISRDEMAKEWAKRLFVLFSGIGIWGSRLPARLEGKTRDEMGRIIEDEIYILRKTFAEKGRYCPEVDGEMSLDDD